MTREEQIKKQADIYTDDASNYTEWSDDGWSDTNDIELVEKAFIQGAKWADNHPKSTWISVVEDLPCNHEELIASEPWDKHTKPVVVCNRHYGISVGIMIYNIDKNAWNWVGLTPTHWFPIPKLPKE